MVTELWAHALTWAEVDPLRHLLELHDDAARALAYSVALLLPRADAVEENRWRSLDPVTDFLVERYGRLACGWNWSGHGMGSTAPHTDGSAVGVALAQLLCRALRFVPPVLSACSRLLSSTDFRSRTLVARGASSATAISSPSALVFTSSRTWSWKPAAVAGRVPGRAEGVDQLECGIAFLAFACPLRG
ncbi:hypothetical protein [Streptomyces chartreusis]|uniref:hypothetical protein n=1 Tax=Streptomyces chartreusis TaxID=1969 RepID=UPI0037BBE14B